MSEEFVEDIIAQAENQTTDQNQSQDNQNDDQTNDQTNDQTTDQATNQTTDDKNSSSTASTDEHKNDSSADESVDDANAPGNSAEVEELASKLGWNKDHKGPDAVDAATYILRAKDIQKTMKAHNRDLKGQLHTLNSSIKALKEHNERVYKAEVTRLQTELDKLVQEKKDAIALADVDKVEQLDQQIDNVKKTIEQPTETEDAVSINPVFEEWVKDNEWYLLDDDMARYADTVAEQYAGAPPERIYALVRSKVAEVFPEKFNSNDNQDTSNELNHNQKQSKNNSTIEEKKVVGPKSPVEKGTRSDGAKSFTKADLTDEQKMIMNQFVKSGIMTEEQYIADIAKLQGE